MQCGKRRKLKTLCFEEALHPSDFPCLVIAHVSSYNFIPPTAQCFQKIAPKKSQALRMTGLLGGLKYSGWICGKHEKIEKVTSSQDDGFVRGSSS